MDRAAAIEQIQTVCNNISRELMRIHPAVPPLNDKPTQDKLYETLYRITTDVETIKKALLKLRGKDDSAIL
jgi:GTP1/Obg family GTP-binding protein